jgi:hypothetical protein
MAGKKALFKNAQGQLEEQRSVNVAGDTPLVNELVSTTTGGIISPALLNAKNTSAGVSDAAKIPQLNANGVLDATIVNSKVSSAGAGDSGKIPALDASGRLDNSFLPVGIGADTAIITASEALAAGDFVNVWASGVRKADASTSGKEAHGFVLTAVAAAAPATVYFEGTNTQVTGMTSGVVFLSPTTAGLATATPPTTAGHISQIIGVAVSATAINFQNNLPIKLV